ncbi:MAG: PAS-domain containing protein [Alphaproteobacteria bacterium]|nr:PAS-domain containing protein [Alphaproteobacteria bacterium]
MGQNKNPGAGFTYGRRRGLGAALASFALAAHPALASSLFAEHDTIATAIAAGAAAIAIAAGLWALAEQKLATRLRRVLRNSAARTRAAVGERDALLGAGREALIVWGRDGAGPYFYGGGEALLESCLKGAKATQLAKALDDLSDRGVAFVLTARDALERKVSVRGHAVGGMAAVWIELESQAATDTTDFRAVLDALPVPVWLRDRSLSLAWANRAFLSVVGAADLDAAKREQVALEKTERDLAAAARSQSRAVESKRFAIVAGQRRALALTEVPVEAGVVGTASDVTDVVAGEARLQQHIDAHTDTLDKLATAVAIFDRDQKLTFFNRAFAKLWNLPEAWLDTHPADGDILDRLREARKLPEQRDYQGWKRERLALYHAARDYPSEELWHVPGGKTLRVVAQPHPFGGLTFLYEDVTERITLESSYNTLIKVQSATLNTLQEGVAVFGPDGKLKLHNAAFETIWDLTAKELTGEPHVRTIAAACAEKFGDGLVWERLIQNIVSGANVQRDMGEVERNDRTILSLALAPLPDGATLVTFADVTDRFRIESVLRERAEALEAADRLKSDFIKHVSYELRTPLNTILGFAEHLATEVPGSLNERQGEYVQAIVSGSNTLKNLVNDILDLALIESGALRLELERIDLRLLLVDVAAHANDWAAKMGLSLEVDCPEDAGSFLADARRIRQVVFNLLSNAFKFTPKGGVIVLGGRIDGEDVQISVCDNGPGIAPEVRANVFERFSAKSNAGQRGGAGLGLALVNRFVELHDGWVEIESEDGTLVRCHLPRRIHDAPTPGEERKTA